MRVIAISGKRGAGKDTLADYLVANASRLFGCRVIKVGLADPIKQDLVCYFGADPKVLWGENRAKEAMVPGGRVSYREAMKLIGAAYAAINPTFYVHEFYKRYSGVDAIVIVCDVRLALEAEMLKWNGAVLLRLTRAENPDDTHVTETSLDGWTGFDAVLDNHHLAAYQTQRAAVDVFRRLGWLKEGV